MAVFITESEADTIHAIADAIEVAMNVKLLEIGLNGGEPVEWTEAERLDLMKNATLLAFLSKVDVACYPLSDSSVLFI